MSVTERVRRQGVGGGSGVSAAKGRDRASDLSRTRPASALASYPSSNSPVKKLDLNKVGAGGGVEVAAGSSAARGGETFLEKLSARDSARERDRFKDVYGLEAGNGRDGVQPAARAPPGRPASALALSGRSSLSQHSFSDSSSGHRAPREMPRWR